MLRAPVAEVITGDAGERGPQHKTRADSLDAALSSVGSFVGTLSNF